MRSAASTAAFNASSAAPGLAPAPSANATASSSAARASAHLRWRWRLGYYNRQVGVHDNAG
eukprot:8666265-Pyramimonas_sp.AAC.1